LDSSLDQVVAVVRDAALARGSPLIDEIHFLFAVVELKPVAVDGALAPLANAYRNKKCSKTAEYEQRLLHSLPADDSAARARVTRLLQATPFPAALIRKQLNGYISSGFYPFGAPEYERFRAWDQPLARRTSDERAARHCAWEAFFCHGQVLKGTNVGKGEIRPGS
jgi:hypothetical protein